MFDKKDYEKYMTHQPYNDLAGLEIDKAVEWKIGSLVYWDRCRIHSSIILKNNVLFKTPLAMFIKKLNMRSVLKNILSFILKILKIYLFIIITFH